MKRKNTELQGWLLLNGITRAQFAKDCGVTEGAVGHWLRGHTAIPAERAVKIEELTGGQVKRSQMRPDLFT